MAASARTSTFRAILRKPSAVAGLAWLVLVFLASFFATALAPYPAEEQNIMDFLQGPSAAHLLGTDDIGRDILSRLMFAGASALTNALIVVVVAAIIGLPAGLVAGFKGGTVDTVITRIGDLLFSLPAMILLLALAAISNNDLTLAMLVLGVLFSAGFMRQVRAAALAARSELYVDAAFVSGISQVTVIFRHIFPNTLSPLFIQASQAFGATLLIEAGLGFLGIAPPPPTPTWGGLVNLAQQQLESAPWLMVPTGGILILTVLAANFLSDAVQESTPIAGRGNLITKRASAPVLQDEVRVPVQYDPATILSVEGLKVAAVDGTAVQVLVDGVSFTVRRGETLGLVGESGCGKTLTSLALLDLLPANVAHVGGVVRFDDIEKTAGVSGAWDDLRGKRIGYISQEPMVALDPAFNVMSQLVEPLRRHHSMTKSQARARALELLAQVGIHDPKAVSARFPHQLSGGMAQRVAIAIALTGDLDLLVADEPTTALDVTIQAEILDLLRDLQARLGMALILVTHDLGVVADICDRVVVMYAGQVVEQGPVARVFVSPEHPYTTGLLQSSPHMDLEGDRLPTIPGMVPLPRDWPTGCRFADRCARAVDDCRTGAIPITISTQAPDRELRCIRPIQGAVL